MTPAAARQLSLSQAWAAIEDDYQRRPDSALACALGDQLIVHPKGASLTAPAFYILGFNGGEAASAVEASSDDSNSAKRWFRLCARAAAVVGAPAWGITERMHWGSPDIPTLVRRLGSHAELRRLLKLHAEANLAMFAETPPLVVWVTGLGYRAEAVEDYQLEAVGGPEPRRGERRGILWQEYRSLKDGAPWLFSRHPTGARFADGEHDQVFSKLAELTDRRRATPEGSGYGPSA